jgi:NADH-quinone oxidoreductase subunit L
MVMALGVGAYTFAFHLVTHAFFKACLFLGSEFSVILQMHHEQDIEQIN